MKTTFRLLLAFLLSGSLAVSATLEQFLPWLSPNPLALGTSFADFKKIRPEAVDISGKERKPGEPFEGGLFERLPYGSFGYSFFDDKLAAAFWAAPASPETAKLLLAVRNSLLQTCGEPTFGTTGRIKTHGGVARIVWEDYRPHIDKNYRITLRATSESGIEIELINEPDAKKRGIATDHRTYEEVVQSLPSSIPKIDTPSVLVDLLDEARSGRLTDSSTSPEAHEPKRGNNESANPTAQQPAPKKPSDKKPQPLMPVEKSPSATRWPTVAVGIMTAIGLLWLVLKKRK